MTVLQSPPALFRATSSVPCRLFVGAIILATLGGVCGANEQSAFLQAERALKGGDLETFDRLDATLTGYPLYPYLRFAALTRDLSAATDDDIEIFLERFPQTQLAPRLRLAYLARLAQAGRWSDYARFYRADDSVERRCLFLHALMQTGRCEEALHQVAPIWLSARSQPAVCDPVFSAWREAGALDAGQIAQRVRLAMEAGNIGLARHLIGTLPADQQARQAHWLAVDADPTLILDQGPLAPAHPESAAIIAHGLVGLAARSPAEAADALALLKPWLAIDEHASDRAHAAIGQALTAAGDPRGLAVWDALSARPDNLTEQEARLRAAIGQRAWDRVAEWVKRMPDSAEKRARWLYWLGRAEAGQGRDEAARNAFAKASEGRTLWAFLAADRLGLPYRFEHARTPAEPERIRSLVRSPTLARMRELSRLGRDTDLRREWRELLQHQDGPDLLAAAYVADVMRWHDLAVPALAQAGDWDDLELRFPVQHRDLVGEQAWQAGVEPDWILAVIRQESIFARTLASHAGAVGLMQILPRTALEVARWHDLDPPSRWDLLNPAVNIALGTAYLARMRDRFGHVALATAAYNAGPARVVRWLPDACLDADLWILSIPFLETRRYVERVLAYRVIYGARLGLTPTRLSDWLPPVPGAGFYGS